MKFIWTFEKENPQQVKYFLKEQGISKSLLAKVKFQGGQILVNDEEQNVLHELKSGDQVTVIIPDEKPHETLLADAAPLKIVFEDEHLLVVNKPAGVASIPAQYHPNNTMANRVKYHYVKNAYPNQVVHIVTRLDRDTTGLMLFAKHGFAHAKLDQQLRTKQFTKRYQALVSPAERLLSHERITLPIARDLTSLLKRKVDSSGQFADTEYWLKKRGDDCGLVDIQLHTGRTHQIRVHFSAIGCPLLGDELYGGSLTELKRQALHCYKLQFRHPFTNESLTFEIPLASDMQEVADQIRGEN